MVLAQRWVSFMLRRWEPHEASLSLSLSPRHCWELWYWLLAVVRGMGGNWVWKCSFWSGLPFICLKPVLFPPPPRGGQKVGLQCVGATYFNSFLKLVLQFIYSENNLVWPVRKACKFRESWCFPPSAPGKLQPPPAVNGNATSSTGPLRLMYTALS